jgi:hypothetical protein
MIARASLPDACGAVFVGFDPARLLVVDLRRVIDGPKSSA